MTHSFSFIRNKARTDTPRVAMRPRSLVKENDTAYGCDGNEQSLE